MFNIYKETYYIRIREIKYLRRNGFIGSIGKQNTPLLLKYIKLNFNEVNIKFCQV